MAANHTNALCSLCIHSHTANAGAKGMSEAEYREVLAIVGVAPETNRLVDALGVPIDEEYQVG
ncbi:MAG: hypothetical protein FJX45_18950 [Alphaproteobacteria bacterium]|nr:hypothetical protein [Alphaproteobacteria bacterium]MBM3654300.1 hypothetical protein [Alphaproteobacteria bacterium]